MSAGRIVLGDAVGPGEERPDVCVVGSGAGGAVVAARLAEAGARVLVLEDGGVFTPGEGDLRERVAYPRLYAEHGQRATADLSIGILQGRAVGGSTVVNWTTSFRTPPEVLAHWARVHGIEGLDPATLAPHFEAVERRISVHEWPAEKVNANNQVLWDGAGRLGWSRERLRRNVDGCQNLGFCGMGCPIGAKQSMDRTFLPDAVERGATILANTRAVRLEASGGRVVAIEAEARDPRTDAPNGRRVTIRPRLVVLAAGAIGSPELLLRSGLDPSGRTGRRTFLHPVVPSIGVFARRIDGFAGAPQSIASHHHADRGPGKIGFFVETTPIHPVLAAGALGGFGPDHAPLARLPHAQSLIALAIDGFLPGEAHDGGRVTIARDGRVKLDYPIPDALWEALREGNKAIARLQLAAGAEEVRSVHDAPIVMRTPADVALLDHAPWIAGRVNLFSAHVMGGCAMGADRSRSVVDARHRHHHLENVFVADGSALPTSLGVNPQLTIMALAHRAAEGMVAALG